MKKYISAICLSVLALVGISSNAFADSEISARLAAFKTNCIENRPYLAQASVEGRTAKVAELSEEFNRILDLADVAVLSEREQYDLKNGSEFIQLASNNELGSTKN